MFLVRVRIPTKEMLRKKFWIQKTEFKLLFSTQTQTYIIALYFVLFANLGSFSMCTHTHTPLQILGIEGYISIFSDFLLKNTAYFLLLKYFYIMCILTVCKVPCWYWELNLGPLVFSITEPFLQHLYFVFTYTLPLTWQEINYFFYVSETTEKTGPQVLVTDCFKIKLPS